MSRVYSVTTDDVGLILKRDGVNFTVPLSFSDYVTVHWVRMVFTGVLYIGLSK